MMVVMYECTFLSAASGVHRKDQAWHLKALPRAASAAAEGEGGGEEEGSNGSNLLLTASAVKGGYQDLFKAAQDADKFALLYAKEKNLRPPVTNFLSSSSSSEGDDDGEEGGGSSLSINPYRFLAAHYGV